jgi:protein O-mannosyl-transferase
MAKKNKVNINSSKPNVAGNSILPKPEFEVKITQEDKSTKLPFLLSIFISAFAFFIYSNTFEHRFVLDDHGIIKNNKITKAPMSWENTKLIFSTPLRKGDVSDLENSLYRPAIKMLFNIEWNLFGANEDVNRAAHKFHIINVLMYAILCGFIFLVLYDAFKQRWLLPLLITLLFAAHPMHVEAIANIKSGDEVLSLLGIVIALRCIQLYFSKGNFIYVIIAFISFLIGSFSKESTLVAVAIFPLFIYFFTNANFSKNIIMSSMFLICTLFFLFCRHQSLKGYPPAAKTSALDNYMVLCDPAEQAVLKPDLQEKYKGSSRFASAVSTMGFYVKTFVIPHPLSCDCSYSSLEPIKMSNPKFLLSFIFFLSLFIFAIYRWKQKDPIAFGILWFFIAMSIVSNIFILIGTSYGERLFFAPSLGLSMVLVAGLAHFLQKDKIESTFFATLRKSPILVGLLLLTIGLYSIKTFSRNRDWKKDFTLFSTDIKNYPNSTHLLFYLGNHLAGLERKEQLTAELTALNYDQKRIDDSVAKENLQAIRYFNVALDAYPALPSDGYNQLGKAYYGIGQLDSAFKYYMKAHKEDSTNAIFINNIGTVYYNRNQVLEAFPYFMQATKTDPTEPDFANNVGCIYGATNRLDSAVYWFDLASKMDPLDITSLNFLEITYRNMGKLKEADYYKSRLASVRIERQNANN